MVGLRRFVHAGMYSAARVGKGLPATSLEISFIERLRARREWEQDRTFDVTRAKIVIEREIREWQLRDHEIRL